MTAPGFRRRPGLRPGPLQEQDLGVPALTAPAPQAGGEDAAAVDDEQVARAEQVRQVAEPPVGGGAGQAVQNEEAGRGAVGHRLLRDQPGGKLVVEVVDLQNSFFCGVAGGGTRPKCW